MSALEELKARTEGHTSGPWFAHQEYIDMGVEDATKTISNSPERYAGKSIASVGLDYEVKSANAELITSAPKLLAALEAVAALHYADAEVEGLYPQACSEGPCEHGDDCPEVTITPCYGCSTPGWNYIAWPCPTIAAIEEALR